MKNKKIKALPILLALLMVLCIVPSVSAKAATPIPVPVPTPTPTTTSKDTIKIVGVYVYNSQYKMVGDVNSAKTQYYLPTGITNGKFAVSLSGLTKQHKCTVKVQVTKGNSTYYQRQQDGQASYYEFTYFPNLNAGEYTVTITVSGTYVNKKVHTMKLNVYKESVYYYVNSMYRSLGYSGDAKQMAVKLSSGTVSARTCATTAYRAGSTRNRDGAYMVDAFYSGLLGRYHDQSGYNYWCANLASGTLTKDQVFDGFIYSTEFQNKVRGMGITW